MARGAFGSAGWLTCSLFMHGQSAQRKELVARELEKQGVAVQPALSAIDLDDWVVLSLPQLPRQRDDRPVAASCCCRVRAVGS